MQFWYSKVSTDSKGWNVEIKIPYQALRFPKQDVQKWGLNFQRNIRRYREIDYWNTVDPKVLGVINQCGDLDGLTNIISPVAWLYFLTFPVMQKIMTTEMHILLTEEWM